MVSFLPCLLISCTAPRHPKEQQPSWRTTSLGGETRTTKIVTLSQTASAPKSYNAVARPAAKPTPLFREVHATLTAGLEKLGIEMPLQSDGRLNAALDALAEIIPLQAPLPPTLLEFALRQEGIVEPSPFLMVIESHPDNVTGIVEQLQSALPRVLATGSFNRFGVGSAVRGGQGDVVLIALQESHLDLQPVPRSLPPGTTALLQGQISPHFSHPQLFQTTNSGKVLELPSGSPKDRSFSAQISCRGYHGRQQVEITATGKDGSTVLANFPVWCGEKPPKSLQVEIEDNKPPKSRKAAEFEMIALVNEARRRHGIPPLAVEPRLTQIARGYSDEMARTGIIAHVSQTSGSASDRVAAGGVRTSVVRENLAQAYNIKQAQAGLMNSPGHRANILALDVTHIGIGVTIDREVSGQPSLITTQLFIRIPKPIDSKRLHGEITRRIRAKRPLASDNALHKIAQSFADDLAAGKSPEEASLRSNPQMDRLVGFRAVSTLITTVSDIADFDPAASVKEPSARSFGVGVAQGTSARMGEGAIFIVVLIGQS